MKTFGFVVTGLAAGCWLAGCSAPAPSSEQKPRDIQLIEAPNNQAPSVSDLEARRPPKPAAPARPIERRLADQVPPPAEPEPVTEVPATEPAPAVEVDRVASGPAVAAAAPAPADEIVEVRDRGVQMSIPTPGSDYGPMGGSQIFTAHRPVIMIRGGRGGIDDDCDLDRPGAHGMRGVAINRTAPGPQGGDVYTAGPARVGGRSGGMSAFPRGGIR